VAPAHGRTLVAEKDGHLDMLFVGKDAVGAGVGRKLCEAVERDARGWGLGRVFTEASITARTFFARRGFRVVREQTVVVRGVSMTNFVMEKDLPG
jgi:putative acetyltransferase